MQPIGYVSRNKKIHISCQPVEYHKHSFYFLQTLSRIVLPSIWYGNDGVLQQPYYTSLSNLLNLPEKFLLSNRNCFVIRSLQLLMHIIWLNYILWLPLIKWSILANNCAQYFHIQIRVFVPVMSCFMILNERWIADYWRTWNINRLESKRRKKKLFHWFRGQFRMEFNFMHFSMVSNRFIEWD